MKGLLHTDPAPVLQGGKVSGASGLFIDVDVVHFQEMELWLSLNAPLFWLAQRKERKKRLKISESLLSSLKTNHYCTALGSRRWVGNTGTV